MMRVQKSTDRCDVTTPGYMRVFTYWFYSTNMKVMTMLRDRFASFTRSVARLDRSRLQNKVVARCSPAALFLLD